MTDSADTAAQSTTAVAGGASSGSTISRDDIQNMFKDFASSLDVRFASLESQMSTVKQAAIDSQVQQEHVIDIGADEAQMRGVAKDSHEWSANAKRSYDEYQDLALRAARRSDDFFEQLRQTTLQHTAAINKLVIDRLANATNNDQIAVDREWNVNSTDSFETMLSAAVANALNSGSTKTA